MVFWSNATPEGTSMVGIASWVVYSRMLTGIYNFPGLSDSNDLRESHRGETFRNFLCLLSFIAPMAMHLHFYQARHPCGPRRVVQKHFHRFFPLLSVLSL